MSFIVTILPRSVEHGANKTVAGTLHGSTVRLVRSADASDASNASSVTGRGKKRTNKPVTKIVVRLMSDSELLF